MSVCVSTFVWSQYVFKNNHQNQQAKTPIMVKPIGLNRAKIEIVCARDQTCKFTYVRRESSLKGREKMGAQI